MKKIVNNIILLLVAVCLFSCEKDNYDAPDCTIQGRILDHNGNQLETEQGNGNMRIKMEELSWANGNDEVSVIPRYLNMKQDGSYVNNKWFTGEYRMTPIEGAFYPYPEEGDIVRIEGTVMKDFTVTPYLTIEWVKEPVLTADNYIEASVRFRRNAKDGAAMPDLSNGILCVSTNQYCGNNNKDGQLFNGTKTVTNDDEGTVIEFRTSMAVKYTGTIYWVRVGICCNDTYKKYNYTDIKTVTVN
ncbi:MAG TPA: hypothetical protein DEQ30_13920 [Porphyromonadaceae bacterium]|nr:hypothetical protein [Porphyromonadaceae bacterium]